MSVGNAKPWVQDLDWERGILLPRKPGARILAKYSNDDIRILTLRWVDDKGDFYSEPPEWLCISDGY